MTATLNGGDISVPFTMIVEPTQYTLEELTIRSSFTATASAPPRQAVFTMSVRSVEWQIDLSRSLLATPVACESSSCTTTPSPVRSVSPARALSSSIRVWSSCAVPLCVPALRWISSRRARRSVSWALSPFCSFWSALAASVSGAL